jgi:NSS family neurotransmitter:Na+ symporter
MSKPTSIHGQWSSRFAFIMAATGSAVGLGNVWKFPYLTGENGGGAFVLVYLLCVIGIGVPVMIAEIMLGRRGRQSPINTMRQLVEDEGRPALWQLLGWAGVVAGFIILSYYSVIGGWTIAYVFKAASGLFGNLDARSSTQLFGNFIADPWQLLLWHSIFMAVTGAVVSRGVQSGLERSVRFMMPALFLILLALLLYAMNSGAFMQGLAFMLEPDFSKLSGGGVLSAMGQAFFSLSLGLGAIMMYGSYLPQDASIAKSTLIIASLDTLVAIMAGLVVFPLVFANQLTPGEGPGLVFQTLPIAFGQMPFGNFFGALFFVLLVFAAWTSSISLVEPAVAWLVENRNQSRTKAAALVSLTTWFLGIATILSFNAWAFDFDFLGIHKTNGIFDILDILTSNLMLPLGGLFIAIFASWCMRRSSVIEELAMGDGFWFKAWYLTTRFLAPLALGFVFLNGLGLL